MQCHPTDLHTLLYTCTLYLDRNSQAKDWRIKNFLKIPRYYNLPFLANFPFSWSWQTPPVKKAKEWLTWTATEKRPRWLNEDTISMKLETNQTKIEIDNQSNRNFLWSLGVDGWHAQRRHALCWGWRYKICLQIESEPFFSLNQI